MQSKRTYVYIDGFNLYHRDLKGSPYKWLDLKALFRELLDDSNQIVKIKYFTALVSGKLDSQQPIRQQTYLRALSAYISEIEIHYGQFLSHNKWFPLVHPVPKVTQEDKLLNEQNILAGEFIAKSSRYKDIQQAGKDVFKNSSQLNSIIGFPDNPNGKYSVRTSSILRKQLHEYRQQPDSISNCAYIIDTEEKGSDVNMAVHILNDAWLGCYDCAVVLSNDSDLAEALRLVKKYHQKIIGLILPENCRPSKILMGVANFIKSIRKNALTVAQLPNPIPNTNIHKPEGW